MTATGIARWFLAALYAVAGVFHLAAPRPFVAIVPPWGAAPEILVYGTGAAELLGAAALIQSRS